MITAVKNNLPQIKALFRQYKAEKAYLFGSAATGDYNSSSDIDFLFSFPDNMDYSDYADNYFNLLQGLRDLLNREIDLVSEKTIKNPYLNESIEENKIQLL